jgi:hypothetical protein
MKLPEYSEGTVDTYLKAVSMDLISPAVAKLKAFIEGADVCSQLACVDVYIDDASKVLVQGRVYMFNCTVAVILQSKTWNVVNIKSMKTNPRVREIVTNLENTLKLVESATGVNLDPSLMTKAQNNLNLKKLEGPV